MGQETPDKPGHPPDPESPAQPVRPVPRAVHPVLRATWFRPLPFSMSQTCAVCGHVAGIRDNTCGACGKAFPPYRERFIWQYVTASGERQLVMYREALLPDFCIKTNEPCDNRIEHTFQFRPWGLQLLPLFIFACGPLALLIGFAAMLDSSRKRTVSIAITDQALVEWRKRVLLYWALGIAGVLIFVVALGFNAKAIDAVAIVSAVIVVAALLLGNFNGSLLRVAKIDPHYIFLRDVSPAFLQRFPEINVNASDPSKKESSRSSSH
jgi:hypothetical protein